MTTDSRKGARRFLFVAPRYHSERAPIVGGAEVHSRAVVERLVARGHDVRVLTSCATSYKSWRNALPEGDEIVSGVRVTRFPTIVPRIVGGDEVLKWATTAMKQGADGLARLRDHDAASVVRKRAQRMMERAWIEAQGPMVPKLLRELPRAAAENDVVVFYGYLYSTTIFGLPKVAERSVMAPLADEEPMLYAPIVREVLRASRALLLNVEEEAERVRAIVEPTPVPMAVVALGIDPPPRATAYRRPTDGPFVLVLGRAGKTRPMAPVWRALTDGAGRSGEIELDDGTRVDASKLTLVTAGEISSHLEGLPRVVQLGRVDDATRWGLMRDALAMVSPSESESLSLVVLESWLAGRSVIVNRACDATEGHVRRSRGGVSLDFDMPIEGARALVDAIRTREVRDRHATSGRAYVEARYGWSSVLEAYEAVADALADGSDLRKKLGAWSSKYGAWSANLA